MFSVLKTVGKEGVTGFSVIAEKNNATDYLRKEGYIIHALVNIIMGHSGIDSVEPKSI